MLGKTTDTIDHILNLDMISNRIDALHLLFSVVSLTADLDIDTIKTIAENLSTTVNDVVRVITNSITKLLLNSHTIYAYFILCIIIIACVIVC